MTYASATDRHRVPGALAAVAAEALLAALIVQGLAAHYGRPAENRAEPTLVALPQPKPAPPPPPPPPPRQTAEPAGAGAPPARKAEAAPREAPLPKIAVAAPRPATREAGQGAAAREGLTPAGSGSGAGGSGDGRGSGEGGSGRGAGAAAPPLRIAGVLGDRDYPRSAARRRAAGTAAVSFRVRSDGRVDRCQVIASSGDAELDALTCSLVERRFVYRPARDAAGRPVEATLRSSFTWGTR